MTDLTLFPDTAGGAGRVRERGGGRSPASPALSVPGGGAPQTGGKPNGGSRPVRRHRAPGGAPAGSTSEGGGGVRGGPVGRVAAQVEALLVGLRSLGGGLLEERLGLLGRCEAGLAAVRAETLAELARRGGEAQAAEAARERLRQSRAAARREVKLAGRLDGLPGTSRALAGGDITPRHAKIIAEAAEAADVDEEALLEAAAGEPADTFANTARRHVAERSAGEDPAERRRRQRARRELSIRRQADGMYKLFGLLDPLAGARVETALDAAARKLRRGEHPDARATAPQRYADALEQVAAGGGGAQATTLVVIADYDALAGRVGTARLPDGTPLTAEELVKLCVKANAVPAVFDSAGRPLWLGRASRDANAAQRLALAARDGACVGRGARHDICEPRHEQHWEHGGETDIDNLCLLCGPCHHHEIHHLGGDIDRTPDGERTLRRAPRRPPGGAGGSQPPGAHTHHRRRGPAQPATNQPLRL